LNLIRKISNKFFDQLADLLVQFPRIMFYRSLSNIKLNMNNINQPVLSSGKGIVAIGRNVKFGVKPSPGYYSNYTYLNARRPESKIIIGDNNFFNNNLAIISDGKTIRIGNNCLFGLNVEITDSDFHDLSIDNRFGGKNVIKKDVVIGNNVFIGNNVVILRGVSIGDNCVVGNSSLVVKDIPENSIAAGNPCKVIRTL